ncbi:MAG: hypothetical protein NTY06_04105, partial [Candidatus Gottesmanbacteria bacterium]|nr:hypothetical protein [Candidatus Gottesmanbacteria bacterium]
REESIMAVGLAIKKYEANRQRVPDFLVTLQNKLGLTEEQINNTFEHKIKSDWGDNHFLPPEYADLLKKKLSRL